MRFSGHREADPRLVQIPIRIHAKEGVITDEIATQGEVQSPRDQVALALSGYLSQTQLDALINSALALEKEAWGSCPGCRKRVKVSVPDGKAAIQALTELLKEGYGPPQARQSETQVTVNRTVELIVDCDCECMNCAARSGVTQEDVDA